MEPDCILNIFFSSNKFSINNNFKMVFYEIKTKIEEDVKINPYYLKKHDTYFIIHLSILDKYLMVR